jgi:hypothetical protein
VMPLDGPEQCCGLSLPTLAWRGRYDVHSIFCRPERSEGSP